LKKLISDVQYVYHQTKHMHSDDIAKVCGKSSRICCSTPLEWSKCLQHCTPHINSQVFKIARI